MSRQGLWFACLVASTCLASAQPSNLRVPQGFQIVEYAAVPAARQMVSEKRGAATITYVGTKEPQNEIYAVVDADSDGTLDGPGDGVVRLFAGIDTPNGVALRNDALFFSGFDGQRGMVWRADDISSAALAGEAYAGEPAVVTDRLPGERGHGRRFLQFAPPGQSVVPPGSLVLPVGVPCNVCPLVTSAEGVQDGSLYALDVATGNLTRLATGVRNGHGFDFHPVSRLLYFLENGRDRIGDDRPDCELNVLRARGLNFGFPLCHTQGLGDPYQRDLGAGEQFADPELNPDGGEADCSAAGINTLPVQALGPHTAPLGMIFYRWRPGANFPQQYNNTAFIVQRGSWNRAEFIGYRVMTLQLDAEGLPTAYQQFADGWLLPDRSGSWGRPVDVEQLPDGSLLVSDDTHGALFRITHTGTGDGRSADASAGAALVGTQATPAAAAATSGSAGRGALRGWFAASLLLSLGTTAVAL